MCLGCRHLIEFPGLSSRADKAWFGKVLIAPRLQQLIFITATPILDVDTFTWNFLMRHCDPDRLVEHGPGIHPATQISRGL